ncbi:hypothetical protein QN277_009540 [Acacia crassicarpa]|uniref:EF-hand domain-containing protein n=1 Tax=Acacia crassicarpa TaxID=499986 RepID=A0AAE1IRA2_9FABA|nr:hypothetical protein QN277_009540 [Acacia crassicarpa]
MSVEIVDAATILNFLEDDEVFDASVRDMFGVLDKDKNGFLSYNEMVNEFKRLRLFEADFGIDMKTEADEVARVYDSLFLQFDHDMDGKINLREFKEETKKMMIAIADGIGFLPLQMILEPDSLILKAIQRENVMPARQ